MFVRNFCIASAIMVLMSACEPISEDAKRELAQPVNCNTAQQDIAALEGEKASVAQQAATGITMFTPIALVAGTASGTMGDRMEVGMGDYNKQIDAKIAEIKQKCGIR